MVLDIVGFCLLVLHVNFAAVSFSKKEEENEATNLIFPLLQMFVEPNSCLQILSLRIGMVLHNQEWSGEDEIVG
jgi:hypothetical protein